MDNKQFAKDFLRLSLQHASYYMNEQTEWIHYHYDYPYEDHQGAIPILENVLYYLALMKTKVSDQVVEGKKRINQLLSFQSVKGDELGNFPNYMHQYPYCSNPYAVQQILMPLYWIMKDFWPLLEDPLKQKIEQAVEMGLIFTLNLLSERSPNYFRRVQIFASAQAIGTLLNNRQWIEVGKTGLSLLAKEGFNAAWCISKDIFQILIGLQLVYEDIITSPFAEFSLWLAKTWHHGLSSCIAPPLRAFHYKNVEEKHIYHQLLPALMGQQVIEPATKDISFLYGVLVRPFALQTIDTSEQKSLSFILKDQRFYLEQDQTYSLSMVMHDVNDHNSDKGFHLLRYLWKEKETVHSFVLPPANVPIKLNRQEKKTELSIEWAAMSCEKSATFDIPFYFNADADSVITIDGQRANLFRLGQQLEIITGNTKLRLFFYQSKGDGIFTGHLMKGNRPSQLASNKKIKAYDWVIYLRPVALNTDCLVKGELELVN